MRRNAFIATAVAILFYCLGVHSASGSATAHDVIVSNPVYAKMYMLEKGNLINHTWSRVNGQRYESMANTELLEIPANN